jgi:prepilin-type N-terminal cleavage/methylation domain-containing protein
MNRKAMPAGRQGFTLVEILIVMAILLIMVTMVTGIFNATGVFNRARDARRKRDVARIRVAFEEYFNDSKDGCYPDPNKISELTDKSNCGSKIVFNPWLSPWPCDPGGIPYQIATDAWGGKICSKWYKVLAKLENQSDVDIPSGWNKEEADKYRPLGGNSTAETANYGVSSSNVVWSDIRYNPECAAYGGCYHMTSNGCNSTLECDGPNCYLGYTSRGTCVDTCRVACCGKVCD